MATLDSQSLYSAGCASMVKSLSRTGKRVLSFLCIGLGVSGAGKAAPAKTGDGSLARDARAAMERSTAFMRSISTEGGYLWRYSPDLKTRAGENTATASQIWVQPPGTPSVGQAYLRAYAATDDARYLDAARAAADALAVGQLESGGWDYLVEFDPKSSTRWYRRSDAGRISAAEAAKRKNISTYDDDNTQSALRLLIAVADVTANSKDPRDVRIRAARDYGLAKLLAAQRPNGGWPQRWDGKPVDPKAFPVRPASFPREYPRVHPGRDYMGYYTLNDNTHRDCVMTLLEAAQKLNRPDFRTAALKGADFLLLAQLPEPQPAWAQQYNPQLQPDWARAFEPPCVVSGESAGAMRLLVDMYLETGDEKYLKPLPRVVAWFERSAIAPGRWARMYEIGTNRPIYGDRDGRIYYRVEDLSAERQTGYGWQGSFGIPETISYYAEARSAGREAMLLQRKKDEANALSPPFKAAAARRLEPRVRAIVAALDAQGRWLASGGRRSPAMQITTETFIENLDTLAEYLTAVK